MTIVEIGPFDPLSSDADTNGNQIKYGPFHTPYDINFNSRNGS